MKLLVIHGSPRKNSNTIKVTDEFLAHLKTHINDLEITTHHLPKKTIKPCMGCYNCLRKGLLHCPHKDDVYSIYEAMKKTDGLILTSPTYVMHITAQMKQLIDRLSPLCHRPELLQQHGMAIATTGGIGEKIAGKYLKDITTIWGCKSSGMLALKTPPNPSFGTDSITDQLPKIHKAAEHYAKQLLESRPPKPSFGQLLQYRMQKKLFTQPDTEKLFPADYNYWTSCPYKNYHVKARINPLYNFVAILFEKIAGLFM